MSTQRWTYLAVRVKPARWFQLFPDEATLRDTMNQHGAQGWELVAVAGQHPHGQHLLFKRPA